ncbi:hypothetical protein ACIBH1_03775 [Nonomuraea sp. NPDC050663]|uniref:hypothetical protein n=1 Tax=Nonomuraea sp. NPDC050663 TaxID=3364370 RepID=UPI0037B2E57C
MRAYGRRGVLALAAAFLAVAGCSDTPVEQPRQSPVAAASPTSTAEKPPITPGEAREVFTAYVATDAANRGAGFQWYARDQVTGGRATLTMAEYDAHRFPTPHKWGAPTVWVPKLAAGDRNPWFSALAERDGRPAIVTFVGQGADWLLTSVAVLEPGQGPPAVELDADGYATPLSSTDKSVAISPTFMAPLHASVAEAGPEGIAAGLIAPGPYTTETADRIDADRKRWKGLGYDYDSIFSAGELRTFALRTTDGGALVQYSLNQSTSITNRLDKKGLGIPVPEELRWLEPSLWAQLSLKTSEMHQYATAVPPIDSTRPAAVIAHDSGVYQAKADN